MSCKLNLVELCLKRWSLLRIVFICYSLPTKKMDYNLRNSESYVLPQCTASTYKRSFVNWYLFDLQ